MVLVQHPLATVCGKADITRKDRKGCGSARQPENSGKSYQPVVEQPGLHLTAMRGEPRPAPMRLLRVARSSSLQPRALSRAVADLVLVS